MFPRSERFVDKIEITPGPNHYDIKTGEEDPYKRFGFLGKTRRFDDIAKNAAAAAAAAAAAGATSSLTATTGTQGGPKGFAGGLYERNGHSASLPSLVIDDDTASVDTASVHSNGSTTPDRQQPRRPTVTGRSKSTDKLGLAFAANSNKVEERLKKELADLTDKFERYRIARQKDIDMITEKQKRAEVMYQSAIKDKNSVQTQLVSKENEIADLNARHTILKASLEKSEKAAAGVTDKIGKGAQLQKRIEELEKQLSRIKLSLEEQETSIAAERLTFDTERQQLQQQIQEQRNAADQDALRLQQQQQETEQRQELEMRRAKEDSENWRARFEELERLFEDLKRKLQEEQQLVAELRRSIEQEREQMQAQVDHATETIQRMERETKESTDRLQNEKENLNRALQSSQAELVALTERHQETERILNEQRIRHSEVVETMTRHHEEQQACFAKEREQHAKARQNLEDSIAHLMLELSQNRDALLKMRQERTDLQTKYDHSQSDLQDISQAMSVLQEQHEHLKGVSRQEQEAWVAKFEMLSVSSIAQKADSDAVIATLNATLEEKSEEFVQVMKSIDTIQSELTQVVSQREEVIALRAEEERKAVETRQRFEVLEQENIQVTQQLEALSQESEALKAERDQLSNEAQVKGLSIKSLETEIGLIVSEMKEREVQDQERIKGLENDKLVAEKEAEMSWQKERGWDSERAKLYEGGARQQEQIKALELQLEVTNMERTTESKANIERIQELEARCRAMEIAFEEMYEQSGSVQEINQNQPLDTWKQHSAAVLNVLVHHTSECSISKTEHAVLLEEKVTAERFAGALSATLQEQETAFKKAEADRSGQLTKIAELEDQVRHLMAQVEFLEAENIGKVAIIKALQDEYDYQEKVIHDLSKNEDEAGEVARLEDELRRMAKRTMEVEEWIKEVQADNMKYREAYVKADVAREETLLDMAKLHEELAESENTRLQVENQLQVEVSAMIKKSSLTIDELSRLSKMNVNSAQNLNLKQKVKQVAQLKEEVMTLKKKNITLSNTRDSLRLKCLQVERDLESYKAAHGPNVSLFSTPSNSSSRRPSRAGSVSGAPSIVSSSSGSLIGMTMGPAEQVTNGKLQLNGLVPLSTAPSPARSRSISPGSVSNSPIAAGKTRPTLRSRAARSFMAGQGTL
ncbi:hypothetical protein EDD11_005491 [Mortierella claussenii]|nr:hypothetical protein EDD11_005491 [Mortierella claussenii]